MCASGINKLHGPWQSAKLVPRAPLLTPILRGMTRRLTVRYAPASGADINAVKCSKLERERERDTERKRERARMRERKRATKRHA